jgi:zeaxanthin glucosyltransferase
VAQVRRFLFVVPPLVGHVNPLLAVAGELTGRGHEVAWAGHAGLVRRLAGDGARVFDCALPGAEVRRPPGLTGPAAFRFLWEDFFVPLAEAMAPGVEAAIDGFGPDVVVSDMHAVAGALVSEGRGVPCVTSASTAAELIDPLAAMPKVAAWLDGLLGGLRQRLGAGPAPASHAGDPRYPPYGTLAFTGRALLGDARLPVPDERVRLVGPAIGPAGRPGAADGFPWEWLDPARRAVLVTLGTANADAGGRFLMEAVAALAGLGEAVQGVVVDPGHTLRNAGVTVPPGVLVREHVPQLDLLERVAAVVCHAGHNTVCESLWHGVPLVVAPIRDDQPIVAGLVVDAGAGVRVRFNRVDAARLGAAIAGVLDPSGGHRAAARAIGRSFRAAGGAAAAADHLGRVAEGAADPVAEAVNSTP